MPWPDYYCVERTVDVEHNGRRVRLWVNAAAWPTQQSVNNLANVVWLYMEQRPERQTCEELLDLIVAAHAGINGIQVQAVVDDEVRLGVMAYMVPFDKNTDQENV